MTNPLHWCRGCQNVLLPYGTACEDCATLTPLPVGRVGSSVKPWNQLAPTVLIRLGKAYLAADYEITDGGQVIVTRVRAKGRPTIKVRPMYTRMIANVIAKAEGVL